jgi:hypothetical protein
MPLSSRLAPGFIKYRYTGTNEPHTAILPVQFAETPTPGVDPQIVKMGGGNLNFGAIILEFWAAISDCYATTTSFGLAEVYSVDADTGIRTFIYATDIDEPGTAAVPQVPLVEGVFVFKCTSGKPLKIYTMEGVFAADARNIGSLPPGGERDLFKDYILSADNFVYGRSNAYPIAFVSFTSKENDRLRVQSGFNNF